MFTLSKLISFFLADLFEITEDKGEKDDCGDIEKVVEENNHGQLLATLGFELVEKDRLVNGHINRGVKENVENREEVV